VVEVILDRALAAAGDDDDVLDPRRDRLFHAVLDDGLVDQRQHLFGITLVAGKKRVPSPPAGKTAFRTRLLIPSSSSRTAASSIFLSLGRRAP
jgi:hypothetical protein